MAPGKRRALLAAAALALLLAGLAVLWVQRLSLAHALVGRAVAALGVAGAEMRVVEVGPRGALLEELRVGDPPDLAIERVALRYSLLGLLRGRIGEVAIGGLRLRGRISDGKLTFGALDAALAPSEAGGGGGTVAAPPVDGLVVSDAGVEIATPDGVVGLRLDAAIEVAGGARAPVLSIESGTATLALPKLGAIAITGIGGTLAIPPVGPPRGELAIETIRTALAAPIAVRLAAGSEDAERDLVAGALPLALEITTADGRAKLAGPGELHTDPFGVLFSLQSALSFAGDGLQPVDLSPLAARYLASANGTVDVFVDVKAGGAPLSVTGRVQTEALDLVSATGVPVEGLALRADLLGLSPLRTKDQTLRFRLVNLIGPFEEGEVHWRLEGTQLEVKDAAWRYAGGDLTTAGRFDLAAPELPFTVAVKGVSLEQLLAQLAIADLSGTGSLSGELPLVYDFTRLRVDHGVLTAEPPGGVVKYAPATLAPGSLGVGGDVDVLTGALENFHYDQLRMELTGALDGDVDLGLAIKGKNPRYERGRPVELNVHVETNLPALLRASRSVTGVPEEIERRLRERQPQAP
jgi:hypothetical protein